MKDLKDPRQGQTRIGFPKPKPLFRGVLPGRPPTVNAEREFFIDNLLVRIHCIIVMIRWTGLAPWELNSLFQVALENADICIKDC